MRRRRKPPFLPKPKTMAQLADDAAKQNERERRMREYDQLPQEVRDAIVACPFLVHVRPRPGLNMKIMAEKIGNLKSFDEAARFWREYAR